MFSCEFSKFLRAPFLTEHLCWLFLYCPQIMLSLRQKSRVSQANILFPWTSFPRYHVFSIFVYLLRESSNLCLCSKIFYIWKFPTGRWWTNFWQIFAIEFRCILPGHWKLKSSCLLRKNYIIPRNDHRMSTFKVIFIKKIYIYYFVCAEL